MNKSGKEVNVPLQEVPRKGETSLLVVRCFRRHWIPQARIMYKSNPEEPPLRYKLVGLLIGSEYCSHQIAVSAVDDASTTWALSDADATIVESDPYSGLADES